jgi:hypothetical protein
VRRHGFAEIGNPRKTFGFLMMVFYVAFYFSSSENLLVVFGIEQSST